MTEELQYFAKVSASGELEGLPKKKFLHEIAKLFSGRSIEILVRRKKRHRSVQQNRVQWMYYQMISDVTGYTKSEVHEICRALFLTAEKVNEKTGSVFTYTKSTTELSTIEHIEYTENIKQWAAQEFGIVLPDPNEQMDVFEHKYQEA